MPTDGLLDDGRTPTTSDSAHRVSPTKTGFGSEMSVQARLAVAFSLVSHTDSPVTNDSVKQLFTSGLPKRVPAANSALKCTWLVFIVIVVNQMLSASVIVRPNRLRKTSPTSRSSKNRPVHSFGIAASVFTRASTRPSMSDR